jgi:hypothetical protein
MNIKFANITDLDGSRWIGVQHQGEGKIAVSLPTRKERQAFAVGAQLVIDSFDLGEKVEVETGN